MLKKLSPKAWASISIVLVALVVVIGIYINRVYYPSTDDAYVHGDTVNVASQVSGQVISVNVKNLQDVQAGTLFWEIDPKPYQLAVAQAKAQLSMAQGAYDDALKSHQLAKKVVAEMQKQLKLVQTADDRIARLHKQKLASDQAFDNAQREVDAAEQAVLSAQVKAQEAYTALSTYQGKATKVELAKAQLAQAKLDLSHIKVYASSAGHVVDFSLQKGAWVAAGVPQLTLLKPERWVLANFEETQLSRIRVGQSAEVYLDLYPSKTFKGKVTSVSLASGSVTSLLPPENASGNWVKVVSRFPVKIEIENLDPSMPLRNGASATVTINTRA